MGDPPLSVTCPRPQLCPFLFPWSKKEVGKQETRTSDLPQICASLVQRGVRAVEAPPCQRATAHLQVESSPGWVRPALAVGGPTRVVVKLWLTSAESSVVPQHRVAWLCACNSLITTFEFQLVLGPNGAYCATLNLPCSPLSDTLYIIFPSMTSCLPAASDFCPMLLSCLISPIKMSFSLNPLL